MTPQQQNVEKEEMVEPASTNNGPDETAPDADTQSSDASQAGHRTAEGGSRAPIDPAEGA
ncbi:hypothetical protein GCM10027578_00560 [Spirosoma luteolum]|jgi:hypothetical protein